MKKVAKTILIAVLFAGSTSIMSGCMVDEEEIFETADTLQAEGDGDENGAGTGS